MRHGFMLTTGNYGYPHKKAAESKMGIGGFWTTEQICDG